MQYNALQVNAELERCSDLPSDCQYSVAEVREIFAASMTQAQLNKAEAEARRSIPTTTRTTTGTSTGTATGTTTGTSTGTTTGTSTGTNTGTTTGTATGTGTTTATVSMSNASSGSVNSTVTTSTTVKPNKEELTSSHTPLVSDDEDLTFAQVFQRAQARQVENDKLKEAMFRRGDILIP